MVALSGSLLIGCASDSATTATSPTPRLNPLVGTCLTEGPIDEPVIVPEMLNDGTSIWSWGQTRATVEMATEGTGTHKVDGTTITWLGGGCVTGIPGTHTYTLEGDEFIQTAKDEQCEPRRDAYDGVTDTQETTSPSPSISCAQSVPTGPSCHSLTMGATSATNTRRLPTGQGLWALVAPTPGGAV